MSDINAYLLINLTLADPFTQTWMKLYGYMLKKNLALIQNFRKMNKKEFTKISDYEQVYHFFIKQQQSEEMVQKRFFDHTITVLLHVLKWRRISCRQPARADVSYFSPCCTQVSCWEAAWPSGLGRWI